MDIERIREFTVFAKHMNVTRAANELFMSHPRLSKHLSALEKELGFALIDRRGGRIAGLTIAGNHFFSYAQRMLSEYDSTVQSCLESAARRSCAWFTPADNNGVYKVGQPIDLEGYAWAWHAWDSAGTEHRTSAVAFSADYDTTWTEYPVPDNWNDDAWSYFKAQ